jgi:general secretion pathway protein L
VKPADILNTDLGTVGLWLESGWRWWSRELAACVPARWRPAGAARTRLVAQLAPDGSSYRLFRNGAEIALGPAEGKRHVKVALALPAGDVLTREVEFPLLPLGDLRRAAALEIERLTPFRADAVHFDLQVLSRDPEAGQQRVLLGVVGRAEATLAVELARALGLEPQAVGMGDADDPSQVTFDFLSAIRMAEGGASGAPRTALWWGAAGVVAAINVGLLVVLDVADVAALRSAVEAQRPTVAVALRLRQEVDAEAGRRKALADLRQQDSALRVLDAATKAVPYGAWAQRLEWNGKSVRLTGFAPASMDLQSAVANSPVLLQARASSTAGAAKATGVQPFDISAQIASVRP